MAHLSLAGVSADGRRLLLVSDRGAEFTLDISPALRAALRGETTRIGQLEIQMTSTLRPRDIQTRIRSGEAPESVAEAAGTTVEAIMPFVAPVLAEREHVAERAQKSSVRRAAGDTSGGTPRVGPLGDAVVGHLRSVGAKPEVVAWDAFRREDGRWELTGAFDTARRSGTARFTYDAPGNYVLADNDDARWLVGDLAPLAPAPRDDLEQARLRRLAATTGDELPLGDDAIDLVMPSEPVATVTNASDPVPPAAPIEEPAAAVAHPEQPAEQPAEQAEPARDRRAPKRRGRASVPSWDEIMFGGADN